MLRSQQPRALCEPAQATSPWSSGGGNGQIPFQGLQQPFSSSWVLLGKRRGRRWAPRAPSNGLCCLLTPDWC